MDLYNFFSGYQRIYNLIQKLFKWLSTNFIKDIHTISFKLRLKDIHIINFIVYESYALLGKFGQGNWQWEGLIVWWC